MRHQQTCSTAGPTETVCFITLHVGRKFELHLDVIIELTISIDRLKDVILFCNPPNTQRNIVFLDQCLD